MTQTEPPALPEPNFENHDNGDVFGVDKTYFYTADQMRAYATAYADARVAAALLEERERQQSLHMRRLTGLWRFGREVLPVANVSFEAYLSQLDGLIDWKTKAHPLTQPAVKEG